MSAPAEEFYSEERWQNWIDRLRDEDLDPEDEDSARLLLNLQDDVAIAVAKIIRAYEDDDLEEGEALEELTSIHETVSADPGFDDEDTAILVAGVQMSLDGAFYAAQQYIADGVADEADIGEYLGAAVDAEAEDDLERAAGFVAAAGTHVIEGEEFDIGVLDEVDPGYVSEWINGLDSLQNALSDPEVIEE